jgi:type I restriction enzyme S subunit
MVKEGYKEVKLGPKVYIIPETWNKVTLNNLKKELYAGGTPRRNNEEYYNGTIPWVKSGELNNNFIIDIEERISNLALKNSSAKLVPENSVLIAMYGATAGQVALLVKEAATNQAVLAVIPDKEKADSLFLYYSLSREMKRVVLQRQQGTGQQNLSKTLIKEVSLMLPPLIEQKKIASILSSVDKSIEKTDEVIEDTKKLKKGLMQELLTKGIGHSEFKEVRLGVKTYTVPINWEITIIEEISKGKPRYGANSSAKDFNPDLPRYVRITDLSEDGFLKNDDKKSIPMDEAESYYLEEGDIVFARSGATVGKTYIYDSKDGLCAYAGYLIRFKIDTEKIIPKYLLNVTHSYYYSAWVKSMIRATSQPNINSKEYASFDLLLPPLKEQKKIASILSSVDAKIQKEEEYKAKLEQLKKGLMQKLLTGQIRVDTEMEV